MLGQVHEERLTVPILLFPARSQIVIYMPSARLLEGDHTILRGDLEASVTGGVDNGLYGCDPSHIPAEDIEGGEVPAGEPDEDVVASREHPQPWKIGIAYNTCSISYVSPLLLTSNIAIIAVSRRSQ